MWEQRLASAAGLKPPECRTALSVQAALQATGPLALTPVRVRCCVSNSLGLHPIEVRCRPSEACGANRPRSIPETCCFAAETVAWAAAAHVLDLHELPETIDVDKSGAKPAANDSVIADTDLRVQPRRSKSLNEIVE